MKKAIIILYIAFIFMIGWISYISYHNLTFDPNNSSGLTVACLGIMVTFLVAWQIYTTIISKEQVKELYNKLESIGNKYKIATQQNQNITKGWHRFTMGETSLDDGFYIEAYSLFIQALKHFIDSPLSLDDELVLDCLYSMEYCIEIQYEAKDKRSLNQKKRFIENYPKLDKENQSLFTLIKGNKKPHKDFLKHLIHLKRLREGLTNNINLEDSSLKDFPEELTKEEYDTLLKHLLYLTQF